jgi:hypothetical protein
MADIGVQLGNFADFCRKLGHWLYHTRQPFGVSNLAVYLLISKLRYDIHDGASIFSTI